MKYYFPKGDLFLLLNRFRPCCWAVLFFSSLVAALQAAHRHSLSVRRSAPSSASHRLPQLTWLAQSSAHTRSAKQMSPEFPPAQKEYVCRGEIMFSA